MCTIPHQHTNKDTVQENTSTKAGADQESYDRDGEATHRRKNPEDSHSGEKKMFSPFDSRIFFTLLDYYFARVFTSLLLLKKNKYNMKAWVMRFFQTCFSLF